MKKRYLVLICLVVFALIFWGLTTSISKAPSVNGPINSNPSLSPDVAPAQKEGKIIVSSPLPNATLTNSPFYIKGRAVGNWFFEASAPVEVVNWDGLIIGGGYISVDDGYDWMTTEFVPFSGSISYDASQLGPYKYGWIIMKKDNPSGEPQFDDSLEFKILFP